MNLCAQLDAVQGHAVQAVAALSGTLRHLHLTTAIDASWLPPLAYLTRLELCFARRRRPHRFAEGELCMAILNECAVKLQFGCPVGKHQPMIIC